MPSAAVIGVTRPWDSLMLGVHTQSDFSAVAVSGRPVNHLLHLLLTFLTAGIWLIVWITIAAGGGEKRYLLAVDELGNVTSTKLG